MRLADASLWEAFIFAAGGTENGGKGKREVWHGKCGSSKFACGVVISYVPSFLDDLLLL